MNNQYGQYYAPFSRQVEYYNPSVPQGAPQGMPQDAAAYQQYQPRMRAPTQPQQQTDLNWVLNETEAVSYPVACGGRVVLWDTNRDTVYIKSVDVNGVPSMRILDYAERDAPKSHRMAQNGGLSEDNDFVSAADFRALQERIDGLQSELSELKAKAKPKTAKSEADKSE